MPQVEEAHDAALSPEQLTIENARRKACAISLIKPGALVIGADTLVYVDGEPLGKPADMNEALTMVRRLSSRAHEVCTGVAFACDGRIERELHVITHVIFKPLNDAVLQGMEGSFTNVVGLPVDEVAAALRELSAADPAP